MVTNSTNKAVHLKWYDVLTSGSVKYSSSSSPSFNGASDLTAN